MPVFVARRIGAVTRAQAGMAVDATGTAKAGTTAAATAAASLVSSAEAAALATAPLFGEGTAFQAGVDQVAEAVMDADLSFYVNTTGIGGEVPYTVPFTVGTPLPIRGEAIGLAQMSATGTAEAAAGADAVAVMTVTVFGDARSHIEVPYSVPFAVVSAT